MFLLYVWTKKNKKLMEKCKRNSVKQKKTRMETVINSQNRTIHIHFRLHRMHWGIQTKRHPKQKWTPNRLTSRHYFYLHPGTLSNLWPFSKATFSFFLFNTNKKQKTKQTFSNILHKNENTFETKWNANIDTLTK